MKIGTFRRNVGKTLTPKVTKLALRTVSRNTLRTNIAQATVALKGHTGQLLQILQQYVLGLPQTDEMKNRAFVVMGDIGFDLVSLSRFLKVKVPSSTKKSKLVGTRAAAILQLDGLSTDLLRQVEQSLFSAPKTSTVKKMVSMPQKGGAKEERDVEVVDAAAELAVELERQEAMKSFLAGAIDVFWRLNLDLFGQAPETVLKAKADRMVKEYPGVSFDDTPKAAPKTGPKPKAKKGSKPEAVPA